MFALRTFDSLDEVRKMTAFCKIRAEVKPCFFKPPEMHVIKATKPMEQLSIDFKGHIGNLNRNNYILTVIDKYSRFPFAFPCSNINAETVIKCLTQLIVGHLCITRVVMVNVKSIMRKFGLVSN